MAPQNPDIQQQGRGKQRVRGKEKAVATRLQPGKRKKNAPWVLSFAIIETEKGRNGGNGSAERERERGGKPKTVWRAF